MSTGLSIASQVILMTSGETKNRVTRAFTLGCCGIISKGTESDLFLEAIRKVYKGETCLLGEPRTEEVEASQRGAPCSNFPILTPLEREVASLLAKGLETREIAERLFLTLQTVETCCEIIYQKLGITPGDSNPNGPRGPVAAAMRLPKTGTDSLDVDGCAGVRHPNPPRLPRRPPAARALPLPGA